MYFSFHFQSFDRFNIFAETQNLKYTVSIFVLVLLSLVMLFLNLNSGNASISLMDIFQDETARKLIVDYRLPKSLAAILAGIALPISGLLLQELFRNPLADPSVLGITSSAGLGVAMIIFASSIAGYFGFVNNPWILSIASFVGALIGLLVIGYFSTKLKSTASLIIVGMMIAGFSSAIIGILQFFAPSEKVKTYLLWTFGSISGLNWTQVLVFSLMVGLGILISCFTLKGIMGLRLGEQYAHSMGIPIKRLRTLILLSSAILTAATTAFVGPIAFIGLAIPHIVRILFKETQILKQFVLVMGTGVVFMLTILWISQLFETGTLPINIITSLMGAPFVMSIILRKSNFKWDE